ncbi:HEAT repeat domain-containing protein [Chloroflexota bacterium]
MELNEPLPAEQVIAELCNTYQPLLNSNLAELSNLTTTEQKLFENSWTAINPERRRQIINRLVELADENVELYFNGIFKYCLRDQDDEVRSKAIDGLWEDEETSLIDPLIKLLEQDSSEKVQVAAATAMGKFAVLAECNKLSPEYQASIQQTLLKALGDDKRTVEVRRRTLESIAPLSIPQVKTVISEVYRSTNPKLRISAIYAMGKNYDSSWLPILLKELSNDDAEVRYEAAGACGELEEEAAVPGLIKLVNDFDADVQMAAIQALGKIGGTEAKECLAECLESESEVVRQMAEQVMGEINTQEDPLSFGI